MKPIAKIAPYVPTPAVATQEADQDGDLAIAGGHTARCAAGRKGAADVIDDVCLTVGEVADLLNVSESTVQRRIRDKTIRKVQGLGRLVRIHPSEIARLASLATDGLFK